MGFVASTPDRTTTTTALMRFSILLSCFSSRPASEAWLRKVPFSCFPASLLFPAPHKASRGRSPAYCACRVDNACSAASPSEPENEGFLDATIFLLINHVGVNRWLTRACSNPQHQIQGDRYPIGQRGYLPGWRANHTHIPTGLLLILPYGVSTPNGACLFCFRDGP